MPVNLKNFRNHWDECLHCYAHLHFTYEKAYTFMDNEKYNQELFRFIQNAPTPFHAVVQMTDILEKEGFEHLKERDAWKLEKNKGYFVVRNASSLIAFFTGSNRPWETGMHLGGAHTDSPCLKVKPCPEVKTGDMVGLGIELYGGGLLNTWFDRGLNLAGRVTCLVENENGKELLQSVLINYDRPFAVIPSLAIHLDRDANKNRSVNPQTDMLPFTCLQGSCCETGFREMIFDKVCNDHPELNVRKIMDFDLSFSDAQPPFFTGLKNEMISAPRLDNLLSCHALIKGIVQVCGSKSADENSDDVGKSGNAADTGSTRPCLVVLADHEEVGSETASGAGGTFLDAVLERIIPESEKRIRTMAGSMMISWDNAHAAHPSYLDRHDANHLSKLNNGPVLKINASQRYASDSESAAFFRYLCEKADVPVQTFVMRSDMPCGSTIGPAISSLTGVKTVDAGAPTLAMHAIREITGNRDAFMVFQVIEQFFRMTFQPLLSLT